MICDRKSLLYLATPYSRYPGGIERAFQDAAELAARLLTAGYRVYSPIAHTHPIAIHGGLDPLDHTIWLPFDETMMLAADAILVAHMEGWQASKGIAHEIAFFRDHGKPILNVDPETLAFWEGEP